MPENKLKFIDHPRKLTETEQALIDSQIDALSGTLSHLRISNVDAKVNGTGKGARVSVTFDPAKSDS